MTHSELQPYNALRGLLRKYNLTYKDYSKILKLSENSISLKLNKKVKFSLAECKTTQDYFVSRGENITLDELFFDALSNILDKPEVI